MKHEEVITKLLEQLDVGEFHPNLALYHYMAEEIVKRKCFVDDIQVIQDADVNDFLTSINTTTALSNKFISDIKEKMLISRLTDPNLADLNYTEASKIDNAIENLPRHLERIAAIIHADNKGYIEEKDFSRLGLDLTKVPIKLLLEHCPLIKKTGDQYAFKNPSLQTYFIVQNANTEANSKKDNDKLRQGADRVYYFPQPKPKTLPWQTPPTPPNVVTSDPAAQSTAAATNAQTTSLKPTADQPASAISSQYNVFDNMNTTMIGISRIVSGSDATITVCPQPIKKLINDIHENINESYIKNGTETMQINFFIKKKICNSYVIFLQTHSIKTR